MKGKDVAPRSMLHAYSITIDIPGDETGKTSETIVAEVPKDMQDVLKALNFKI
jgi:hypothetical protein